MIFASGLKYVGLGTTALGWILCGVLLVAGVAWFAIKRPWEKPPATHAEPAEEPQLLRTDAPELEEV